MSLSSHIGTAEIIAFPVRYRAPSARFEAIGKVSDAIVPRIHDAAFSSGWYHDAAIEDAIKGPTS